MDGASSSKTSVRTIVLALAVVIIWGLTFVSFAVVSNYFTPSQVMCIRCVLAYLSLWVIYPHFHKPVSLKVEVILFFAGLMGTTLFIVLSNSAYAYTTAPVISVLSSLSPIFTALFTPLFFRGSGISKRVFVGFIVALIGAAFVTTGGDFSAFMQGGGILIGAALAIGSAMCWAVYTLLLRKMGDTGLPQLYVTRRLFLYGIVCIIPFLVVEHINDPSNDIIANLPKLADPTALLNMLFLAFIAYTFCHVGWGQVTREKGGVWASQFTYITPIAAMIGSALILGTPINAAMILGTVAILAGVMYADGTLINKLLGKKND